MKGTARLLECNADDDLCMEKYLRNAAMIQVFYEELNYETMAEVAAYPVCDKFYKQLWPVQSQKFKKKY